MTNVNCLRYSNLSFTYDQDKLVLNSNLIGNVQFIGLVQKVILLHFSTSLPWIKTDFLLELSNCDLVLSKLKKHKTETAAMSSPMTLRENNVASLIQNIAQVALH